MSDLPDTAAVIGIRIVADLPAVRAGAKEAELAESGAEVGAHDCDENAVPYESDGALGHGFECGVCGAFLQAG